MDKILKKYGIKKLFNITLNCEKPKTPPLNYSTGIEPLYEKEYKRRKINKL